MGLKERASVGQTSMQPPHPMQGLSFKPKEPSTGTLFLWA